jgi:hypothetical protein
VHGKCFQERFRSKNVPPQSGPNSTRKRWQRHYVRVPWSWVGQLRSAKRVSTWCLAHVLLYEHWRTGGKPIVLSNVIMKAEGISARSKWRALEELTKLGLIGVKTEPGKSPRITLHRGVTE